MNILGNVKIALRALRANLLRSGLTVLGIVIGVAAVVALLSIGRGATSSITSRVSSLGSNLVTVSGEQFRFGPGGTASSSSASLYYSDYQAILSAVPGISAIAPYYQSNETVASSTRSASYSVTGATPDYMTVRSYTLAEGRFINAGDYVASSSVVVLGSQVAADIFDGLAPLGRTLNIGGTDFTVVGVFASSGTASGISAGDNVVIIPLSTGYTKIFGSRAIQNSKQTLSGILISASSADAVDTVIADTELSLRSTHSLTLDDTLPFTVSSSAQALATLNSITNTLTIFLGVIAGISLLVGGIGIMNIELVSVTERTREIGLRKAVGATQRVILLQFLIETMTLAVMGGVLGILLGSAIAGVITLLGLITAKVTADVVLLAFFSAAIIGLFFGIYPAYQASKLRPIVALRYE